MKRFLLCIIIVAAGVAVAPAQKVSGRSSPGSINALQRDSAGTPAVLRVRSATYDFEFTEPSGDNYLEPRETGRLRIILSNTGKVGLRNVVARVVPLSPPTDITFNDSTMVGDIPVNATRYVIFYFTASENVRSQILTFQIDIHDAQGSVADSRLFTFLTRERRTN